MLEAFSQIFSAFPYAIATGLLVSIVCAVFGVFVILKRIVFIGITLSEIAACGVAGALLAGLPPIGGALVTFPHVLDHSMGELSRLKYSHILLFVHCFNTAPWGRHSLGRKLSRR